MSGRAGGAVPRPLDSSEFAELMSRLGPFERAPRIAVGVSGGADSLALTLLLHDWVRARGGELSALTVDHGLRPEAAAEAALVARTLRPLGIAQRTLRWRGPSPAANVQAAARRARYALLSEWCARAGVLHLALAHHLDDQAETWLLRLGRGSGLDGLAAMAPLAESPTLRLLRPLLGVPKARLEASVAARGLTWSEDPTNRDPSHARVRVRALMPALAAEGVTAERLCTTAAHLGRARAALETALARLLVRAARVHPAGFAEVDPAMLAAAPEELSLRALSRLLMTVGGLEYAPRLARLERLLDRIRVGLTQGAAQGATRGATRGATLGGCRIVPRTVPWMAPPGRGLLVVREPAPMTSCPLRPGESVRWDGRFEIAVARFGAAEGLTLAGLGAEGWAELRDLAPWVRGAAIPAVARPSLPALRDAAGLLAVPHLGYRRGGAQGPRVSKCRFAPRNGLTTGAFTVA